MQPPHEEVHITIIVQRRLVPGGWQAWNPVVWAQSMVRDALAHKAFHGSSGRPGRLPYRGGVSGWPPGVRASGQAGKSKCGGVSPAGRAVLVGLGILCLIGSAYSFYLAGR